MAWNLVPRRRAELANGRFDDPFRLLEQHVQRFFEEPFGTFGAASPTAEQSPMVARLDVSDTGDALVFEVELPGVAEEDVDLSITQDVLRLRAEKRKETKEERKGWYLEERSFGSFERSIRLPVEVEADQAEATFDRGVLRVTLPKSQRGRDETKKIAVRSGGSERGQRQLDEARSSGSESRETASNGRNKRAEPAQQQR